MSDQTPPNPFLALFSSPGVPPVQATSPSGAHVPPNPVLPKAEEPILAPPKNEPLECLARDIFFITCRRTCGSPAVYLKDIASSLGADENLDMTLLGEALFERLLLTDLAEHVLPKGGQIPDSAIEERTVFYLYECWRRLLGYNGVALDPASIQEVRNLITRNMATSLQQPDLYPTQDLGEQLLQLLMNEDQSDTLGLMSAVVKYLLEDQGEEGLAAALTPTLDHLQSKIRQTSLLAIKDDIFQPARVLAKCGAHSARLLVKHSTPKDPKRGRSYCETLLGSYFDLSCLPGANQQFDFSLFSDVINQPSVLSTREEAIHSYSNALLTGLHVIVEAILKSSPENRRALLDWFWACLEANDKRGSIGNVYNMLDRELSGLTMVPDGFAVNLEALFLTLCLPFCSPPADLRSEMEYVVPPKLLTVDPSFCAVETGCFARGGLHKLTCLLPPPDEDGESQSKRPHSETFSFITECFFLAHRATDLGSRVARERLMSLNQDTARIERLLSQIEGGESEAIESVRRDMERTVSHFLTYRAVLTNPIFIDNSALVQAATASWLMQLFMDDTPWPRSSFAPGKLREVSFPLSDDQHSSTESTLVMRMVPELLIENFASYILMARKFHSTSLERPWLLWPCLTLVVSLMGSPGRVKNPHLRARLAEVLESMLPWQRGEQEWLMEKQPHRISVDRFQRERLFKEHPHRFQIAESLVRVFCDIEMTGQSVQFEQKFSYRQPMYIVLEHLWSLPEHRECFRKLSEQAEKNMEAVNPPVFLRFANLLINDAVFLLDEALAQMASLREKQSERENGDWDNMPPREREQNERNLEHMGQLARSYNILGRETIHMLEMLTSEIQSIFCHQALVDRIAAMLNYFLLQLVGPKSKSLKVHNMKEFEFDPGRVVMDICFIYTHLGSSTEFCAAVSRDGRSYNDELFPRAERVLARIGGAVLLADLRTVAAAVAQQAARQSCEDELLAEAPDEFLDPITAALMTDPVILPSSQVSIDRATIARHLLSDQMDPFNRSPLTMDQVLPNRELKEKIDTWVAERLAAKPSTAKQAETTT